jgi:hypothetical protein
VRVARDARADQDARAAGAVQDHEGGLLGPGAGLGAPPEDAAAARQAARTSHVAAAQARLADAVAVVRTLRESTAAELRAAQGATEAAGKFGAAPGLEGSDVAAGGLRGASAIERRRAQAAAVAAGKLGAAPGGEGAYAVGGGLAPSADFSAALRLGAPTHARAAGAADLEVHHYGRRAQANFGGPADAVGAAQAGGFASARASREGRRTGRSKAPEFRSHTQAPNSLGAEADRTFGAVGEHAGPHTGGLSIGTKSIRASSLFDGGDDTMAFEPFEGGAREAMGAGVFGGRPIGLAA